MSQLEAHMIEPIRQFMHHKMRMDITAQEFSAGYGFADLVGAALCAHSCQTRKEMGLDVPLDHRHIVQVLLALRSKRRTSLAYILQRVAISESTLRNKVLPQMDKLGLIGRDSDAHVRLISTPPKPAKHVVAVEAKQTKWRDAILQARRYTFFANQTYVAVWSKTAPRVDKALLYRHRIGLISVELNGGCSISIEAPSINPRAANMNRLCAEYLYRQALDLGTLGKGGDDEKLNCRGCRFFCVNGRRD